MTGDCRLVPLWGLRSGETLELRWGDLLWDKHRLRVPSPKTEHHEGHAERFTPLFPELRQELEILFEMAEPGSEFVISGYQANKENANLRTQFTRIIRGAGLKPWDRRFHNLRASRLTELAARHPAKAVSEWVGCGLDTMAEH